MWGYSKAGNSAEYFPLDMTSVNFRICNASREIHQLPPKGYAAAENYMHAGFNLCPMGDPLETISNLWMFISYDKCDASAWHIDANLSWARTLRQILRAHSGKEFFQENTFLISILTSFNRSSLKRLRKIHKHVSRDYFFHSEVHVFCIPQSRQRMLSEQCGWIQPATFG